MGAPAATWHPAGRGAQAEGPQLLVEQHDGVLEGPALAAAAGLEAAVGATGLAVPAGEELHDAVELGALLGGEARRLPAAGGLDRGAEPLLRGEPPTFALCIECAVTLTRAWGGQADMAGPTAQLPDEDVVGYRAGVGGGRSSADFKKAITRGQPSIRARLLPSPPDPACSPGCRGRPKAPWPARG